MDTHLRRDGNTTRAIDDHIQNLFLHKGEWCNISDPWEHGFCRSANQYLVDRLRQRMKSEHPQQHVLVDWKNPIPYAMILNID